MFDLKNQQHILPGKTAHKNRPNSKIENILKGSLDLIPSPLSSVKIQIMGEKVCLGCKGKTLLGIVNKLLKTKAMFCLITSSKLSQQ